MVSCSGHHADYQSRLGGLGVGTRVQQRQSHRQHVFDAFGVVDGHAFGQFRGQVFFHVLAVFGGQDDDFSCSSRSNRP